MAHVVSIPVSTGQVVQAGQTLIVLDAARQQGIAAASQQQLLVQDEAIRVAEASITAQEARTQASQAELKRANNELRRATALLQQQALAPADYDTAKRNADQAYATVEANLSELNASIARLNLAKAQRNSLLEQARGEQNEANLYRLQAPFTGKIGDILPKVGELVAPTADMIELTRQLNPIVKAQISVEASKHITVGMKARIVDEQQQPIATASVLSLSDRVSLESQTRLVRLKITTHTTDFYQGQYVRAELIPPSQTQVVIPFELVTFMAGQPFAYVAQHPEPAKKATAATMPSSGEWVVGLRPLTLGSMVNNSYIVKQGLRSGDRIIASSLQKLQPNAPIQLLPEAASPQATPATSTSSSSTVGH
jgi:multidrug resistance efflux pump